MSLADYIPEKFRDLFSDPDFSKAIKGYNLYLIKEDPEYREEMKTILNEELDNSFDERLVTSELIPIPRIAKLEAVTGLCDYSEFEDEDREPSILEKISKIEDMIEQMLELDIQGYTPAPAHIIDDTEETFIPETKIQKAAIELIKYACSLQTKDGIKAITPKLLHQFRKHILSEELRPNTVNPRQWKKDVTNIVCDLSPVVEKDKKGNNRGIRLVFPRNFNLGMLKCKLNVS